jgi:F420 biosynthesis protein FbiB-like protein
MLHHTASATACDKDDKTIKTDCNMVTAAITGRRSIRRYLPDRITPAMIDSLLQVAVSAPSAHNRQPWRFRVITEDAEKVALATAMGIRLRRDRLDDSDEAHIVEADANRSYQRLTGAPAIIVVCMSEEDMDTYPDKRRSQAEYVMAVQSVAMAGQNLLLAIHADGLGACWLCAPLFCPDVVVDVLGLPKTWQPQGLITIGYPADMGKPFSRNGLNSIRLPAR